MSNGRLTQKQENFARYLFGGLSQREAWIKAGYSSNYAPSIIDINACKLAATPKVKLRCNELNQKAEDDSVMGKLERKQRLSEIARARLTDFVEAGADGAWINIGLESVNSAALQSVKSKTEYDSEGTHPTVITDIKLHDPVKAMTVLNEMDDIGVPRNTINIITKEVIIDARNNLTSTIARLATRIRETGSSSESK